MEDELIAEFCFDNFVPGAPNWAALQAAQAFCAGEPEAPAVLVIAARFAGSGRTHLLHAIGHDWRVRYPERRVACYGLAERMEEEITAILLHGVLATPVDLLLLDDIEHILDASFAPETVQRFIQRLASIPRIVVTSDAVAGSNGDPLWQFLSEMGDTVCATTCAQVCIEPLTLPLRLRLLQRWQHDEAVPLERELLHLLAAAPFASVRQLASAARCLATQASFHGRPVTYPEVLRCLLDLAG